MSVVRDGTGASQGDLAQLPPDVTAPTPAPAPAPTPSAPPPTDTRDVVVAPGDNLWELAARRLATTSGRARADVTDAEIAPYWVRVCDENRARLASGDPNLVFPGERIVLPPVS